MKRILTTLAVLAAFAFGASARTTAVKAVWISPDPSVLNTLPCNDSFTVEFLFINAGPETVTVADTFFFQAPFTPQGRINLRPTTAPIPANDTIVHYRFKTKISQLQRLADPNNNNTIVYPPFANGNYLMFIQAAGFYNATTAPAGALEMEENDDIADGAAVKIDCGGTGIDDLFGNTQKQALNIYPNPTTGKLNFKYNFDNTAASVRVTDIAGRVVMTQEFGKQSGVKEISLDVSALNNGMYFVELTAGGKQAVSKVTVQK